MVMHCVSKKRTNFCKLQFQQTWTSLIIFGEWHQYTFKNDMRVQLSLSLPFKPLLTLFLNRCERYDVF